MRRACFTTEIEADDCQSEDHNATAVTAIQQLSGDNLNPPQLAHIPPPLDEPTPTPHNSAHVTCKFLPGRRANTCHSNMFLILKINSRVSADSAAEEEKGEEVLIRCEAVSVMEKQQQ